MPLRLSGGLACGALMVVALVWVQPASAQSAPSTQQCQFQGVVVPCTVHAVDHRGVQQIDIGTIDPSDWLFAEKDLPRDATALHVELLNDTTLDTARRYVLAQFYRLYRADQARKLLSLVTLQLIQMAKRKYGTDMTYQQVIEAIVIEAGLPVINLPAAADDIQQVDIMQLLRQEVGSPERK